MSNTAEKASVIPCRLQGRLAIVTGGANGIGAGIVRRLLAEGASVVVADIDGLGDCIQQDFAEACRKGRLFYYQTDISSEEQIIALMQKVRALGQLSILVNCAACFVFQSAEEVTEAGLERSFAVNIKGTALTTKHAALQMLLGTEKVLGKHGGAIVNICSISSQIAQPGFAPYSMTKGAVAQMTRNQALDLGKYGIRVNAVNPGPILTEGTHRQAASEGRRIEEMVDVLKSNLVIDRMGRPEDVAAAVAFLVSDDASFITGTALTVDGGYTLQ